LLHDYAARHANISVTLGGPIGLADRFFQLLSAAPGTSQHLAEMRRLAPQWLEGCRLRECWFEPAFHKRMGKLFAGVQIHMEDGAYGHGAFRPRRLMALAFKAIRHQQPDYELWRDVPYEHEYDRLAIGLINGGELLRQWVDDPEATSGDLEALAGRDEVAWMAEREGVMLYRQSSCCSSEQLNACIEDAVVTETILTHLDEKDVSSESSRWSQCRALPQGNGLTETCRFAC
jgi:hypothetical protein